MRQFLLFCLFLTTAPMLAQLTPVKRVDYPVSETVDEDYQVLALGEQGVLLTYYKHDDYARRTPHSYTFTRLDTTLATRWKVEYTVPENFSPSHSFENARYVFHLFTQPDTDNFSLVRLSLYDGTLDTYSGKLPSSLTITDFKTMGNVAYLAGYYRSRPVVMAYSLFDSSIRVFQGLYINNVELGSMEVDEYRQEVHVVTHTLKKDCEFTLRSYSPDGRPLRVIEYSGTQYSLVSGKILPISADESLLVGNYSTDCTPYSQGLFITRIQHNETGKLTVTTDKGDAIRYVDFSSLKNFFNYLKPKRQKKMQERLAEQKRLGKEYKFRYRLLVHDLTPTPNGLRLVAEVYYPQFRGSISSYSSRSWRAQPATPTPSRSPVTVPMGSTTSYSDGYRYTHAFVCEFDQQGNLLWDNCLPISDLTDVDPTQKVEVSAQGSRLAMAYVQDSDVYTTVIERDSVLASSEPFKLPAPTDKEKVQSAAEEGLIAWYGPYFLATGYQKLVAERGYTSQARELFYLNKLIYNAFSPPTPATTKPKKGDIKSARTDR
ncbi:hypothetical protein [Fibrivirga algicola]|uniref:YARHG domain-containing protein n=1 Tax=Fibrivirga algicola TaxID=2950420 RepID=A0ABX0QIS1_9BACT|nr:hypothetical protein [Fibrivirga algicola]NID10832.1 hypothetical protein [Fibrivirga algicola]